MSLFYIMMTNMITQNMQKEQMSRVYGESFIVNGMMDDAIFTFLTVFQSYQDVVQVIMKGCAH